MPIDEREDIYEGWYLIDRDGCVSVLQLICCQHCSASGWGYVRMDTVEDDQLQRDGCPHCRARELKIITYKGQEGE
jgi:hypothetical protein